MVRRKHHVLGPSVASQPGVVRQRRHNVRPPQTLRELRWTWMLSNEPFSQTGTTIYQPQQQRRRTVVHISLLVFLVHLVN